MGHERMCGKENVKWEMESRLARPCCFGEVSAQGQGPPEYRSGRK